MDTKQPPIFSSIGQNSSIEKGKAGAVVSSPGGQVPQRPLYSLLESIALSRPSEPCPGRGLSCSGLPTTMAPRDAPQRPKLLGSGNFQSCSRAPTASAAARGCPDSELSRRGFSAV